VHLAYFSVFFTFFLVPPVIIGVSPSMIYKGVKQQEQANARYGTSPFTANTGAPQDSSGVNSDGDEGVNHHSWLD